MGISTDHEKKIFKIESFLILSTTFYEITLFKNLDILDSSIQYLVILIPLSIHYHYSVGYTRGNMHRKTTSFVYPNKPTVCFTT